MESNKKIVKKLDVHVNFDPDIAQILRNKAAREERSIAQLVRFLTIKGLRSEKL